MTHGGSSDRWWLLRTCGWGLTWALGVALGVALGGYLTLTSGAGAPGAKAVDAAADLLVLPAAAASGVFVAYLVGATVVGFVRRRFPRQPQAHKDQKGQRGGDDGVERQIGREVPAADD